MPADLSDEELASIPSRTVLAARPTPHGDDRRWSVRNVMVTSALAVTVHVASCGHPSPMEPPAEATSDGSTHTQTDSDTGSSTTGDTAGSTGEPLGLPICRRACELPASCCPADEEGCPSLDFPGNYTCDDGVCIPPVCSVDGHCENQQAGTVCRPVERSPRCVRPCDDDSTCQPDGELCLGQTDDGERYCRRSCTDGGIICSGGTVCDAGTGLCTCEGDAQCSFGFACRAR